MKNIKRIFTKLFWFCCMVEVLSAKKKYGQDHGEIQYRYFRRKFNNA